ncbi:MAG: Two-component system sensor histidine kinase, partial [uncultured Quadrisphaera sp.]
MRARLTLAATAALGAALVVAAVVVLVLVRASLVGALDDAADMRAAEVVALAGARGLPDPLPGTGGVVQVLDAEERVLASSAVGDRLAPLVGPAAVADVRQGRPVLLDGARLGSSERFRVVGRPVGAGAGPASGGTVLVATSLSDVERAVGVLRGVALLGVPALLAVVALLAWRVTGSALAPVESLRRGAEELVASPAPGGAARTLPVPGSRDEVARLATTLNDVLARLHGAGERQRLFVGDAAHELRSPLGSLRTQLEVALAHPRAQRWPEVAADCLADVERMGVLVEDLLVLARLDEPAGGRQLVDLGALAAEVVGERAWPVPVRVAAE